MLSNFSGGQDSTTCLLWSIKLFENIIALSFNYNQKHSIELDCAKEIVKILNCKEKHQIDWLGDNSILEHKIIDISTVSSFLGSELINHSESNPKKKMDQVSTFVPGRNILFLTIAAAYAYQRGIHDLIAGVCQTDNIDYPDCRDATIKSLQATLNLGLDHDIILHTPLMWKNKAETIKLMEKLGGLGLYKYTHTCYEGERPACGICSACQERIKGFKP